MNEAAARIEFETLLLTRHLSRPRRGEGNLESSAYMLLSRIGMQGPMSVGELAEAFLLDTSTLSRQTTAMLKAGLVDRIPDPEGGMARKFRITEDGARRLELERAGNVAGLDYVLVGWNDEDRAAFAAMLRRFNTDIENRTGNPWPRPDIHPDREAGSARSSETA